MPLLGTSKRTPDGVAVSPLEVLVHLSHYGKDLAGGLHLLLAGRVRNHRKADRLTELNSDLRESQLLPFPDRI